MNVRQRRKLLASTALIPLLLGAFMVVVPSSVGAAPDPQFVPNNPGCAHIAGTYELEAKHDTGAGLGEGGTATATDERGNTLVVDYRIEADGTVSFEIDSTSDYLVSAVLIKQGNYLGNNSAAVYYYNPAVAADTGLTIYPETDDELSHITFCGSVGSISVDKNVMGDEAPDSATPFAFTLECTNNGNEIALGADSSFTLTDLQAAKVITGIPEGSSCTLDETPVADAETTITVDGDTATEGTTRTGIVVGDGTTRIVVVTNDFPGEEASLTVVKELTDEGDATFPFTLNGDAFDSPLGHEGTKTFGTLDPGTYTVAEDTTGTGYQLEGIVCVDDTDDTNTPLGSDDGVEVDGESVEVTLVDGDSVTCTFTNGPIPDEPTLRVSKEIASEEELDDTFEVSVTQGEFEESDELGDGDSLPLIDPASGEYVITETLPEDGWEDPTIECTGATASAGEVAGSWTVDVDDEDVSCTITNTPEDDAPPPPPPPGPTFSIDIDKTNDADEDDEFNDSEFADDDEQAVTFQIVISNTGTGAVTVTSLVDTFDGVEVDLLEDDVALDCDNGFPTSLVIDAGEDVTCTFTLADYAVAGDIVVNTVTVDTDRTGPASDTSRVITPEVAGIATNSITVVKDMDGELADWEADILATGTGIGDVTLSDEDDTEAWFGLGSGSYTLTEDLDALADGVDFESVSCVDAAGSSVGTVDADSASVALSLGQGEDVVCTFVNAYTAPVEVLPTPAVTPAPAVLGDVVARPQALPRTGSEASGLAGAGAGLLALGMAMVLSSRIRYRRVG